MNEDCKMYKKTGIAPRKFRLAVGTACLMFNHRVEVGTMTIYGHPVIQMVYEATHSCFAFSIRNQPAKEISNQIRHVWSPFYLGPPDFLIVSLGTAYTSKEMCEAMEAHGMNLD